MKILPVDAPCNWLQDEPKISIIPCFVPKLWPIFSFCTGYFKALFFECVLDNKLCPLICSRIIKKYVYFSDCTHVYSKCSSFILLDKASIFFVIVASLQVGIRNKNIDP